MEAWICEEQFTVSWYLTVFGTWARSSPVNVHVMRHVSEIGNLNERGKCVHYLKGGSAFTSWKGKCVNFLKGQVCTLLERGKCVHYLKQPIDTGSRFGNFIILTQRIKKFPTFMKLESSLWCSKKPTIWYYPEPVESIPHFSLDFSRTYLNITPLFMPMYPLCYS
jgi:hypothetical protein